jgi:hypothetical protein
MQTAETASVLPLGKKALWKLSSGVCDPEPAAGSPHSRPAITKPTMKETSPVVTQAHISKFQSEMIGSNRIVVNERQKHHKDPNVRTGCNKSKFGPTLMSTKHTATIAKESVESQNQRRSSMAMKRHEIKAINITIPNFSGRESSGLLKPRIPNCVFADMLNLN